MQSLMTYPTLRDGVRLWTGARAAKALAKKRKLGRTGHVKLRYMWVQEMPNSRRVKKQRVAKGMQSRRSSDEGQFSVREKVDLVFEEAGPSQDRFGTLLESWSNG